MKSRKARKKPRDEKVYKGMGAVVGAPKGVLLTAKTVRSEQPQVITSACGGHVGSEREAARRESVSCQYTLKHTGAWVRLHFLCDDDLSWSNPPSGPPASSHQARAETILLCIIYPATGSQTVTVWLIVCGLFG